MYSLIFMVQSAGFECLSAHSSTNGFALQEMSAAVDFWEHIYMTDFRSWPQLFVLFLLYVCMYACFNLLFILLAFYL